MKRIIVAVALVLAMSGLVSGTALAGKKGPGGAPAVNYQLISSGGGCVPGSVWHRREYRVYGVPPGYNTRVDVFYCNSSGNWELVGGWWE